MPTVTPMPALPVEFPWWLIESLAWDFTDAQVLPNPTGITFNDRANDQTGASLTLQTSDAHTQAIIEEHRVIRYGVLDVAASATAGEPVYRTLFAAIADQPDAQVVAEGEDAAEQTTIRARGALAQWDYVEVDPPGGAGVEPDTPERVWNFAHSAVDIHSGLWTDATYRSTQGDITASDPEGGNGLPYSFSNPLAFWLAPSPVPGTNDYNGIFLLGFDYELDADSQVIFDCSARNAFQLWVNERLIGSVWDYPDGDASKDTWRASAHFPAGTLRVRVAVGNFPNLNASGTTTTNGGLFCMAATRPVISGGQYDEEWLFTTADGWDLAPGSPGRWRALDYTVVNNEPPGPRAGQPIVDLLTEWWARDQMLHWSLSFTATHDSAGQLLPVINGLSGFLQEVGNRGTQVLDGLRDAGFIEYDVHYTEAGLPVLDVWNPGTAGQVRTDGVVAGSEAGGGNLQSLKYSVDHSGQRDQLLVSYQTGTVRVGSGPKSGFLATDAITEAEAISAGLAQLAKADTLTSVSGAITWTDQEAGPYWGWGKYDTIPAVGSTRLPVTSRVMGFNVSADGDTGRPVYVPVLVANPLRPEQRLARSVASLASGQLGGRSAAAIRSTSRQRPMEKVELMTIQWSIPGTVEDLESGLVPPEQLMRLNRILVTSTAGSASTYVAVLADGALAADATIGVGTPVEVWRSYLASVLRPTSRIQLVVGAGGALADHENMVIVGYGAAMGVGAAPAQVVR